VPVSSVAKKMINHCQPVYRKRINKPQPVIKGNCIGDESSSEDEKEPAKNNRFNAVRGAVIIGGDDRSSGKIINKPKVMMVQTKAVIGDSSSDEEEDGKKQSKIHKFTPNSVSPDINDQLSKLYNDKRAIHEHKIKTREEHLRKYAEEHKEEDVKLWDSDNGEEDTTENLTKEELWQKFQHQNVQKPVMKSRKRHPQTKKDLAFD
jgi:hypothetical protein